MNVSPIPTTRIHKDHPKDQIIGDINSATQTKRMTKISEEHAMNPKGDTSLDNQAGQAMQDELLQFRLKKVWRLVDLLKGKHAIGTKWVYRNKKDERGIVVRNKARLCSQVNQMDVKSAFLYGNIEEEVKAEQMMHKIFQMSSMGELTFFLGLQATSTPIETNKAMNKDEEAEDVDIHLYRSMIGSLMYLTASKPGIMFAYCACASDYVRASLDRKSTIGGCQFLSKRLISWQCKEQTIVANSTTEAEYVASANCCG
ncbi:putative reverse transcriptase, RNA-dependent DNA polymerase [Tanacetum coccineum]